MYWGMSFVIGRGFAEAKILKKKKKKYEPSRNSSTMRNILIKIAYTFM